MNTPSSLLEKILHHRQFILAATALLVLLGIVALGEMPRDEFPQFTIRQGLIIGVFPGATSEQVEEQLTKKVEQYLFQYEAVNKSKTYSVSKENVMVIYVDVDAKEKDPDAFWGKLRHGLNEFKSQLPGGVSSLTADNDFGNTSALLLAVESDTRSYRELEQCLEGFENDVRKIPAASKIKHFGLQREVINVYMDDAKLTNYGIKPIVVLAALKPEGSVNYAGEVDDGKYIRPIHIPLAYKSESDIANQIVYSDPLGNIVRIKDVARVVREYEAPSSMIRSNGKKCLIVSLEMRPGNNIVQFGEDVSAAITAFSKSLPPDVKVETISNMPDAVSRAIQNFMKEFWIAIAAVIVVTILLLPRKVALVAASTIPIAILITLGIMWVAGMDLQTVSLAGLIIVLGMVVDNAIVIVDNYIEKLDHGITPFEAASKSVTDLFGSVFFATLVIIVFFVPMAFFMTGMAGDFIRSLPMTVALALLVSLVVAAVLVPYMSYLFIRTGIGVDENKGMKAVFLINLQRFYDTFLEFAFTKKRSVVILGAASFAAGIMLLMIVPQESFPKIERNQFAVEVYLPEGSSLEQTNGVIKELEDTLRHDPRVKVVTSFIGTSSPRFNTLYAPNFPAKHYGQLIVLTTSNEATVDILNDYTARFTSRNPRAHIKWKQLDMLAAKAPVEVRVSGDSIAVIKRVAGRIADLMRPMHGVTWVRTDYELPLQGVRVAVKQDEAIRLGYSKSLLGYSLMVGTKGFPVSTVWEDDYPVGVILKVDKGKKSSAEEIGNLYVTSPFLVSSVPVRQVASVEPEWTEGEIVRRNGVRTITVRADIERGLMAAPVFSTVEADIRHLDLPEGVTIGYGGEYDQNIEAMNPLYYSLVVSIVLTFLVLLYQFRNAKTALLIMVTMPLSLFGAAFGVWGMGYPFSLTAFIGLIGLMGMVVRNGIIYISYAEELRREHGHTLEEAALSAAKRRMRPIFLTAMAAAVGVIPMIASRSSLWGPLGSVICFGLLFGLVLSLLVLPVLYSLVHKKDFSKLEEVDAV